LRVLAEIQRARRRGEGALRHSSRQIAGAAHEAYEAPQASPIVRVLRYKFHAVCATGLATTRVLLERIRALVEEPANDRHDLLVSHEGRPTLEK
jgi:hypothetical protein